MTVALITAIYDDYDRLRWNGHHLAFDDAVLVTDSKYSGPVAPGIRHIVLDRPWLDGRMAAKLPRMRPDLFTGCDTSIWLDGAMEILDPSIAELANLVTEDEPLAGWIHPARSGYEEEAGHCMIDAGAREKYRYDMVAQAYEYLQRGVPHGWGLWETGFMVRRHTPVTLAYGELWHQECLEWGVQDQVSQPFALWRTGLRPQQIEPLPASVVKNKWVKWHHHRH